MIKTISPTQTLFNNKYFNSGAAVYVIVSVSRYVINTSLARFLSYYNKLFLFFFLS